MKTYWGVSYIAIRILNLGTRWRLVVSFTLWPLNRRARSRRYTLCRSLCRPQSRSGCDGKEKKSLPLETRENNLKWTS